LPDRQSAVATEIQTAPVTEVPQRLQVSQKMAKQSVNSNRLSMTKYRAFGCQIDRCRQIGPDGHGLNGADTVTGFTLLQVRNGWIDHAGRGDTESLPT
jgi:hypothetical protein